MKRVMVYAYTHFNLGDDLFLKILCERYPQTQFVLYAPKEYRRAFKRFKNIKVYPSDFLLFRAINFIMRPFHMYSFCRSVIARTCDAGVFIGGSLFIQNKHWKVDFANTKSMFIKGKPFFLLGANFGPYQDKKFLQAYKQLFKHYTDICFRESKSLELFKDLPNVRKADDIVFTLRKENNNPKKVVAISVIKPSIRPHLSNYDDVYYKKIRDITVFLIRKGYEVQLMSFCKPEGDEEAIESIVQQLPEDDRNRIMSFHYDLNIEDALHIIAKSEFIIATRFHSMILGWVYEKPVFPIVYSSKMKNVMDDMNFAGTYTDFKNLSTLTPEEVYESILDNAVNISKQIRSAEGQFEKLDVFLSDK